jgi:hypothetical protein
MASGPFDGGGRSGEQIRKGSPFADDDGRRGRGGTARADASARVVLRHFLLQSKRHPCDQRLEVGQEGYAGNMPRPKAGFVKKGHY